MKQLIKIEQIGRILLARIDNPPHALMTQQMLLELDALVRRADSDKSVGVVIFTGTHPERFIAHYDVEELSHNAKDSPPMSFNQAKATLTLVRFLTKIPGMRSLLGRTVLAGVLDLQDFHDTLLRMGRSGAIFIAAISGFTAGGGLELSLACDLRYISDRSELVQPEVLLAFPPGGGGTQRLSRLIGRARALEFMLMGRGISPGEAERVGLVTAVVAHEQLLDTVMTVAERLGRRPKAAVAVTKQAVLEGGSLPLEGGLHMEQAALLSQLGTPQAKRAMQAYVDAIKNTGVLPAGDPVARKRLEEGTFVDLTDG